MRAFYFGIITMMITHTQAALTFKCTAKEKREREISSVTFSFNNKFDLVATVEKKDQRIEIWPMQLSSEQEELLYYKSPHVQTTLKSKDLDFEQDDIELVSNLNSRKIKLSCYSRGSLPL